jgi:N6-adenosine-specific RNA methylase IME4
MNATTKIKILPELKNFIPPLTPEEYAQLEANCIQYGIQDKLKIARYSDSETGEQLEVLADGHNRYRIARSNDLSFEVEYLDFESVHDAKLWMIDNQKGRRNLSDFVKFELAQVKAEILKEKGAKKRNNGFKGNRYTGSVLSIIDKTLDNESPHNTQREVANELGWSTGKVGMAAVVNSEADEETKNKLRRNQVSINQVYKEIKKERRKKEIEKQKKEIQNSDPLKIAGLYDVIVLDPPWNYGREYDPEGSRVANPYPEMTQSELLLMDVPAKENCIMWLWTTHQFIWDAKELLSKWSFEYKALLTWNKEKIGMGHWLRMQCEFCLLAVKGKPIWDNTKYRDIINEPRREHSRKPEQFYEMVEEICYGNKVEFFAREARDGWSSLGNDTNKFGHEVAG